jgi:hypothetical protein
VASLNEAFQPVENLPSSGKSINQSFPRSDLRNRGLYRTRVRAASKLNIRGRGDTGGNTMVQGIVNLPIADDTFAVRLLAYR